MVGIIRRTDASYVAKAGLVTLALTAFFFLSATSAFAQKRVIQKWVDRVDLAQAGFLGATIPVTAADTQGNVYIAGNPNYNLNPYYVPSPLYIEVIKYNSSGTKVWSDVINTPGYSVEVNAITLDSNGNIFIGGTAFDNSTTSEFVAAKVSPTGSTDWFVTYSFLDMNGEGYASVVGIAVDSSGNSYMTGWAQEDTGGPITTMKFSPTGATLWVTQFNGNGNEVASGMVLPMITFTFLGWPVWRYQFNLPCAISVTFRTIRCSNSATLSHAIAMILSFAAPSV